MTSIPTHLERSLCDYRDHRIKPGACLQAMLENRFSETLRTADKETLQALPAIHNFIWNNLPATAWGSPQRVQTHLGEGEKPSTEKATATEKAAATLQSIQAGNLDGESFEQFHQRARSEAADALKTLRSC
jgi:hypothetical protein